MIAVTIINRRPAAGKKCRRMLATSRRQGSVDNDAINRAQPITQLSLERAYEQMMKARPTPNATIETVKQAVRDRGVSALDEKQIRERLQRCDPAAIAEIDHWLLKRGISG